MNDKKAQASATQPSAEARRPDLFLICLEIIASHYGRTASEAVLTAGLPLDRGQLTLDLLPAAAARIGLRATRSRTRASELVPLDVPALLIGKDGKPLVLTGGDLGTGYAVYDPQQRAQRLISPAQLDLVYSGVAFRMKPSYRMAAEGQALDTATSSKQWFWDAIHRYWRSYTTVILATACINIIALATPIFTMHVYDRVIPNKAMATLWVFVFGLVIAFTFDLLLKQARAKLVDRIGRKIDIEIASTLFSKILGAKLSERPITSGVLANRFNEYEVVREFLSSSTVMLFVDLSFFFVFAVVIYLIGGWAVIVPLLALLIVVGLGFILQARMTGVIQSAQSEAAMRHSVLVEAISGLETIKSIRAEGHVLRRWEDFARGAADSAERLKSLSALGLNLTGYIQQIVVVLIVVVGVYQFDAGAISMGAIIATVMLSNRLVAPLAQIAMSFTRARYVALALKGLDEIMSKSNELVSGTGFVNRRIEHGHIEFRKVDFRYPGHTATILDNFNLVIRPGERIGVIGRIGSGKTTVGRLMTGLFQPVSGEILLDGVDLRQYHPHVIREGIALVVQEAELFYGTVRDNIVVARPTASDEDIVRAAKLSGADQFIAADPKGFDLNVGERGRRLSGGQRQCVALARAFLSQPRVLFLDEPSSSMDMQTERQFIARLRDALSPDQTLIIATHRNSMLQLVERVIVIDSGRVVLDGPRDAVIQNLVRERDAKKASDPAPVVGATTLASDTKGQQPPGHMPPPIPARQPTGLF